MLPQRFNKQETEMNKDMRMNNKFDELTKSLAHSVTRRGALKTFGAWIAGMALACLGLANKAEAGPKSCSAQVDCPAGNPYCCQGKRGHCSTYVCTTDPTWQLCQAYCVANCPPF